MAPSVDEDTQSIVDSLVGAVRQRDGAHVLTREPRPKRPTRALLPRLSLFLLALRPGVGAGQTEAAA